MPFSPADASGPQMSAFVPAVVPGARVPMPKGPQGQKRPADVIGAAVLVGRIATGEVEDKKPSPKSAAAEMGVSS